MQLMGIGDEAGSSIEHQIKAAKTLGWNHIEMRGVLVPGFDKANFHEIPEPAFEKAAAARDELFRLRERVFGAAQHDGV